MMKDTQSQYNKASVTYPYDPTGTLEINFIKGEIYKVSETRFRDYNLIVPEAAPFFSKDVRILYKKDVNTDVIELIEDKDFELSLEYKGAAFATGSQMYGGIVLFDLNINGTLWIDYRTIGGDQIADRNYVLTKLLDNQWNPRITLWESVTNVPNLFPPKSHSLDWDKVKGVDDLLKELNLMTKQIAENGINQGNKIDLFLSRFDFQKFERIIEEYNSASNIVLMNENKIMKAEMAQMKARLTALENRR